MKIKEVTIYHVDMPMKFTFRTAKETLNHRESIILEVVDESGQSGYGETVSFISPFYSDETLDISWNILKEEYIPQILRKEIQHPFEIHCRATLSGSHKQHFIIANFSRKKAQSHLNDTVMPLFLHSFSSVPGY